MKFLKTEYKFSSGISNPNIYNLKILKIDEENDLYIDFYIKLKDNKILKLKKLDIEILNKKNFIDAIKENKYIDILLNKIDLLKICKKKHFFILVFLEGDYGKEFFELFLSLDKIIEYDKEYIHIIRFNQNRMAELIFF